MERGGRTVRLGQRGNVHVAAGDESVHEQHSLVRRYWQYSVFVDMRWWRKYRELLGDAQLRYLDLCLEWHDYPKFSTGRLQRYVAICRRAEQRIRDPVSEWLRREPQRQHLHDRIGDG